MVGKRDRSFASGRKKSQNGDANGYQRASERDLESGQQGSKPRPHMFKFKDAANTALEDKRREDLKKQLLTGVDRERFEKFRKSDEEVRLMLSVVDESG